MEMYLCEYKGIQFSGNEKPDENACDIIRMLAENYSSNLDKIIEFMFRALREYMATLLQIRQKSKLGKPTIEFESGRVSYFEQSFDSEHIIEFEFIDDTFEKLENFTLDG